MWRDIETITDANAGFWAKAAAVADLGFTIFTDINMLDGEGDTADDHDLVLRYQNEKTPNEPTILSAMIVNPSEIEIYKQRGADFIIRSVEDLFDCLPWFSPPAEVSRLRRSPRE